jgi:hypothetical protein
MTDPDWLIVNAPVAEMGDRRTVSMTVVDRFTRTQVVLANGNRYRRDRLTRHTGDAWGPTYRLVPADDPRVLEILAKERRVNLALRVEDLMLKWRRHGDDAHRLRALELLSSYRPETP